MKRRNVVAVSALIAGGVFFGIGVEKGFENIGHEAGIAAEHWGEKDYVKPPEVKAHGEDLTRQTHLYLGAMAVAFAIAAQQRIKQSNLEIAADSDNLVEELQVHGQATERAIGDLALAHEALAAALAQIPETYPPLPELPAYSPEAPEPSGAKVISILPRLPAPTRDVA